MKNYLDREWFWVGGKHACLSILSNNKREINKLICTKDFLKKNKIKIKAEIVSADIIGKYFKDKHFAHQGIAVQTKKLEIPRINEIKFNKNNYKTIIILDRIVDQRNIGSIIRSCLAFNVDFVIIDKRYFNQDNYLFLKSSSGAFEKQKIIITSNIKNDIKVLKKNNFWIYSLDVYGNNYLDQFEFPEKKAFIIGSEGEGIKDSINNYSDNKIKIRINNDIESLNVSNAVTSLLTSLNYKQNLS